MIFIKLENNIIEITLRNVCSLVNLLHIFRTPFHKNPSGELLLLSEGQSQTEAQPGPVPTSKMKSFETIADGF